MKKIFIIGGFGYIGSRLAQLSLKEGYSVLLYDSLIYEQDHKEILKEITADQKKGTVCEVVIGDTRNIKLLESSLKSFQPDFLFHLGELSSVWACNHNPPYTKDINFEASKKVLALAEKLNVPVIYNSTSSLYGNQKIMKLMAENDPLPEPTDFYCKYKSEMEKYIVARKKKNPDFKILVFRPATVCGIAPRMRLELLPNHFTYCAVAKGLIRISEMNAYRASIDIDDLILGYFAVMKKPRWPRLIYNIGSHNLSKMEFGKAVQSVVQCHIGPMPDFGDLRNLQINSKIFMKDFGWKPRYSIKATVKKIENWFSANLLEIEKRNFAGMINMSLELWNKLTRMEPGPLETK